MQSAILLWLRFIVSMAQYMFLYFDIDLGQPMIPQAHVKSSCRKGYICEQNYDWLII